MKRFAETRVGKLEANTSDAGLGVDSGPAYDDRVKRFRFFASNEDFYHSGFIFVARGILQAEIFLAGYREAIVKARDNGEEFEACNLYQVK